MADLSIITKQPRLALWSWCVAPCCTVCTLLIDTNVVFTKVVPTTRQADKTVVCAPIPAAAASPALPAAPPAALSAALDAGYLPCLERTLRTCFHTFTTSSDLADVYADVFGGKIHFNWAQLLAFGEERAAAALLATAAKGVRHAIVHARFGADRQVWSRCMVWFNARTLELVHTGEYIATAGREHGEEEEEEGAPFSAARSATGSSSSSSRNAGPADGGSDSARHASADADAAGGLPPPVQQLVRLLSYGLALWLPLYLELPALCDRMGIGSMVWAWQVELALDLLGLGLRATQLALQRGNIRAAESWRGLLGSSPELGGLLASWRERLEEKGKRDADGGEGALPVLAKLKDVQQMLCVLDTDAQGTQGEPAQEDADSGWRPQLPRLLSPPCDARQVLHCCSNPRCAELAGDSEAGVVLRRCGGACGGAAAYCCAACQRAHWAAGHRDECTGRRRRGGQRAGAFGGGG